MRVLGFFSRVFFGIPYGPFKSAVCGKVRLPFTISNTAFRRSGFVARIPHSCTACWVAWLSRVAEPYVDRIHSRHACPGARPCESYHRTERQPARPPIMADDYHRRKVSLTKTQPVGIRTISKNQEQSTNRPYSNHFICSRHLTKVPSY